jgi:hypothetical protein
MIMIWGVSGNELDESYKRELQNSIMKQLELMNVEVIDNKISKDIMIKVMKRIYSNDYSKVNGNVKDDNIKDTIDAYNELFKDIPKVINVDEVWKYINPMKMEKMFNEMLSGIDMNKIMGNINKRNHNNNNKVTNEL